MANIITAADIQKGDLIKVTKTTINDDRKEMVSYEGTVDCIYNGQFRVASGWNLYAHEKGAVIELLDRPKPKIELPTGEHAVVSYYHKFSQVTWVGTLRQGKWHVSSAESAFGSPFKKTPAELVKSLGEDHRSDFKVLFEGVAK